MRNDSPTGGQQSAINVSKQMLNRSLNGRRVRCRMQTAHCSRWRCTSTTSSADILPPATTTKWRQSSRARWGRCGLQSTAAGCREPAKQNDWNDVEDCDCHSATTTTTLLTRRGALRVDRYRHQLLSVAPHRPALTHKCGRGRLAPTRCPSVDEDTLIRTHGAREVRELAACAAHGSVTDCSRGYRVSAMTCVFRRRVISDVSVILDKCSNVDVLA